MPQLQALPGMLVENGISLLHLACNWPSGLGILVESCSHLATPDTFLFASEMSGYMCIQRYSDSICSEECLCAKSLSVLLETGYCPDIPTLLKAYSLTVRAGLVILSHLKDWRDWLKELAISVTNDEELQRDFNDSTSVLDSRATQTIKSLERRGVSVCEASGLDSEDTRLAFPDG